MSYSIRFENPSSLARRQWVQVPVPELLIPEPIYRVGPFRAIKGRVLAEGVRALHVDVWMDAFERTTYPITVVEMDDPMSGSVEPLSPSPTAISFEADGSPWVANTTVVQDGPCSLIHMAGRIPGPPGTLMAELWIQHYLGEGVARWELLVTNSDPRHPDRAHWIEELSFSVAGGVFLIPYWPRWRDTRWTAPNRVSLARQTWIGDSQAMAWSGVVALSGDPSLTAWQHGPICGVLEAAGWQGPWGPFGEVPLTIPDEQAHVTRMRAWFDRIQQPGSLWRPPLLGLAPNSGQSGSQDDFGASKLGWAWAGGPLHILEAYHSALHEASRPGIWYEADGTRVLPWRHPDHVTWSGYTHWHTSYSGDQLGKVGGTWPSWNGYLGPDREHWSNNLLCGTYLLTGSPLLRAVIEKHAYQFLSGDTLDPRLPGTSSPGPARAIGRGLLAVAWAHRCLEPGSELERRVRERVHDRLVMIEAVTRPPAGAVVAPLSTSTDPRRLGGAECWSWEEPLGLIGLRAAEVYFGQPIARVILQRACASWIAYGWWHDGAAWRMADVVAYLGGQAPPISAYPTATNPRPVEPPLVDRTEGFEEWSIGAVLIATRVLDGELRDKANQILEAFPVASVRDAEWRSVR